MTTHLTFNDRAYFAWCCWTLIEALPVGDTIVHDDQLCDCPSLSVRQEREDHERERARESGDWRGQGSEEQWIKFYRHVRAIVAEAPPMTQRQRDHIATLLRPRG